MKHTLAITAILAASAIIVHAEPRWCSITGKGPNDNVFYPPIAKAARISGVVLSRIIYEPNGKVEKIETISGPSMLAKSVATQLKNWTIKTDTGGDQLCESLIIANYHLNFPNDHGSSPEQDVEQLDMSTPSILRMDLNGWVIQTSGPQASTTLRNRFHQLVY